MAKGRNNGSSDRHDLILSTRGYDPDGVRRNGGSEFYEEGVCLTTAYDEPSSTAEPDRPVRTGRSNRSSHRSVFYNNERNGTAIHQHDAERRVAASAPIDVPELSKIFPLDPFDSIDGPTDPVAWVPPHEYLAREHGRSATTSVFEGVGRTLKGRDMSRVRNAVWSQTGFFG